MAPVIRLYPVWVVLIVPVFVCVTEKRASVVSGVFATCSAMLPFISQYGTKPKTSCLGTGRGFGDGVCASLDGWPVAPAFAIRPGGADGEETAV